MYEVIYTKDAIAKGWASKGQYGDHCWLLCDVEDGKLVEVVAWDGGEPEDQLLIRDWDWVPVALNKLRAELDAALVFVREGVGQWYCSTDCGAIGTWYQDEGRGVMSYGCDEHKHLLPRAQPIRNQEQVRTLAVRLREKRLVQSIRR